MNIRQDNGRNFKREKKKEMNHGKYRAIVSMNCYLIELFVIEIRWGLQDGDFSPEQSSGFQERFFL